MEIEGQGANVTDPNERVFWKEAMDQVAKGWIDGSYGFDEEGELVAAEGSSLANPAFRFGAQQVGALRGVDDLERRQTHRAAAMRTPVYLPVWGHFAAAIRTRKSGLKGNLAAAKADHEGAYKQLPVKNGRNVGGGRPRGPYYGSSTRFHSTNTVVWGDRGVFRL